MTSYSSGIWH